MKKVLNPLRLYRLCKEVSVSSQLYCTRLCSAVLYFDIGLVAIGKEVLQKSSYVTVELSQRCSLSDP
ncbi:hypothetical protein AXX17_AT2G37830 [Arabidopsis thaliana]|uniref:Uncharacterized protein n=1 Tax=Arabidopsis thaliana TaxID=3702 RepID=A0A178VZ59_ARATH|nr:hypothetical protein AXX17_AT2G37830 [Arabidopsis thaliana]